MLNILIVEDEIYTLRCMEKLTSEHPKVDSVAATSSGSEAISLASNGQPDVAFLDIELAPQDDLNGIEVAHTIYNISPKTRFVFVTGYAKYAIDSFVVHPYEYLLKPIKRSRVIEILSELDQKKQEPDIQMEDRRLILKTENGLAFVNTDDIFFLEKMGRKAYIHSSTGKHEINNCNFIEMDFITDNRFLRVHKSFVINIDRVSHISEIGNQTYEVHFANYDEIALMSRQQFRAHLDRFTPSV